jgi:hypothetical protein
MSPEGSDDYKVIADACTNWWRELQSLNPEGKPIVFKNGGEKAPDRAALARLRRIGVIDLGGVPTVDVAGALDISAFRMLMLRLLTQLESNQIGSWQVKRWLQSKGERWEPFAIAAATLALIRTDVRGGRRGTTAKLLGQPRGEGSEIEDRLFAETRFKRLIRTRDDWPGLLAQAQRVAAILGSKAPIGDLGASLILWNADPHVTRDWAFQYYQREFALPGRESEPADA